MNLRLLLLSLIAFAAAGLHARDAVEGDWRMTASGTEFRISRPPTGGDSFEIILIDSPDMSLLPGTLIGTARITPTPGRYVARMLLNPAHPHARKRDVLLKITPEGNLEFEPFRSGKRISLWRWLPYLFRVTVLESGHEPAGINGAVRMGPDNRSGHRVL